MLSRPANPFSRWLPAMGLFVALAGFCLQPGSARGGAAPRKFVIVPAESRVTVHLFREGLFSGFAHDHVLVAGELSGQVTFDPANPASATGRVVAPVVALRVDLPEDRRRAGLTKEISAEDRASVRENMLAAEQLDAGRYPEISGEIDRVEGEPPSLKVWIAFRIKGVQKVVPVAASITLAENLLTAEGAVELLQSDFGIVPFSLLLGTVSVQDRILVQFRLVAREQE